MIQFTETLTENDYRLSAGIHYQRNFYNKLRPLFAAILVLSGIITVIFFKSSQLRFFGLFFMLFGLYIYSRKAFFIKRFLKNVKSMGNIGKTVEITIEKEGTMMTKEESNESKMDMKKFYGYIIAKEGVLLYSLKNLFLLLKKEAMGEDQYSQLLELLEELKLDKLKD